MYGGGGFEGKTLVSTLLGFDDIKQMPFGFRRSCTFGDENIKTLDFIGLLVFQAMGTVLV
jgi:hypothetical protein